MRERYLQRIEMELTLASPLSDAERIELGKEMIECTRAFFQAKKRKADLMNGIVDIFEYVIPSDAPK